MSSDAENRARVILLPGQELELPVEEKELPATDYSRFTSNPFGTTSTAKWAPVTEPTATSFSTNGDTWTQLQSFYWPVISNGGPVSYFLADNMIPGTVRLTVTYDVGIVEDLVEEASSPPISFLPRFTSANFTAEIDYRLGMLTIIRADLSILDIQVKYQTKFPGAWL